MSDSLSSGKKLALGVVSASLGVAALGVALKMIHVRQGYDYNDYSDDEEDEREHLKFLANRGKKSDDQHDSSGSFGESAGSQSSQDFNVFNSSRLNVFNSSRLNDDISAQNDSIAQMHDLSAAKLLPDNVSYMDYRKLLKVVRACDPNYVIFDLRLIDYKGGHIAGSLHIPDKTFYAQLATTLATYHNIPNIVLQCMDGSLRSIENIEYYAKARNELIKYYNKETQTSYFYEYKLKIQHEAHKTVMRSMEWSNKAWMERFVTKKKIEIDFSKYEGMYDNLRQQKLFVVVGGFFDFINSLINDQKIDTHSIEFHQIVADFDSAHWEELNVMGEKKLYHKTEYYTTRQINPLRKTQTKCEF